jgi:hypothetical protein
MLYRIKFISDEKEDFIREIKIDSESTFEDLHSAILLSCNYADDQMTSFFICNDEWELKEQITRENVIEPGHEDEDLYVMSETALNDFIEDEGQKMLYVFDPFSERSFFLEVKELIPGEYLKAPIISRSIGDAPQQIMDFDVSMAVDVQKANTLFEDDTDFFDEEGFNSDEFDPEGFEISDYNDAL